uniref:Methyltransferase domain-containing protein n=1 Tax=Noctiluca scintillans TaxID=2966 RepID=A0A7S0ZZ06_NOCSC
MHHTLLRVRHGAAVSLAALSCSSPLTRGGIDPPTRCETKGDVKLVTNWSDPKKAMRMEANYKNPEVVASRAEMVALLRPAPGERILDVGCGPGFLVQEVAVALGGTGCVEGLDSSPVFLELAGERLSEVSNVALHVGTAEALPFADDLFDAVVMSQVLLYVPDVPLALREARRVLRPGGRLLICDTDWDSLVANTADRERFGRIRECCCSTFLDAHLPPKLPGMLSVAGLRIVDSRTFPMLGAGRVDPTDSFVGNWAFRVVADKAPGFGLPASDVEAWLEEQRRLNEEGAFFACVHRFFFLAVKPE